MKKRRSTGISTKDFIFLSAIIIIETVFIVLCGIVWLITDGTYSFFFMLLGTSIFVFLHFLPVLYFYLFNYVDIDFLNRRFCIFSLFSKKCYYQFSEVTQVSVIKTSGVLFKKSSSKKLDFYFILYTNNSNFRIKITNMELKKGESDIIKQLLLSNPNLIIEYKCGDILF